MSQPKLDQQTILQAAMTVAQDPPSLRYWEEGGDLGCTWPEWTGILSSAGWPSVEKSGYKHRLLFPRSWLLALARELKLPRSSVVRLSITDRSDGKRGPIRRSPEDARNRSVLCNEDEYRVLMKVLWWLRDDPKNREKLLRLIKVLGRSDHPRVDGADDVDVFPQNKIGTDCVDGADGVDDPPRSK